MPNGLPAVPVAVEETLADMRAELDAGARVLLMVRHAERPHMDHDDPTFCETLPLTPAGIRMAEDFGTEFKAYRNDVQFLSSPLLRTRQTAAGIARGMGLPDDGIPVDDTLGNSTPYFADQHAVFELFRDGHFFDKIFTYFATARQIGFADLYVATEQLEAFVLAQFTARLGVFTTHDLYNAAFLFAKKVVPQFTEANWVRFLDCAAIVLRPDGTRRYAFVRSNIFP